MVTFSLRRRRRRRLSSLAAVAITPKGRDRPEKMRKDLSFLFLFFYLLPPNEREEANLDGSGKEESFLPAKKERKLNKVVGALLLPSRRIGSDHPTSSSVG